MNRARSRRRTPALGLALAAALSAHTASANGRYPAANQLVVAPSDSQTLLLRATFGFLLSHDTGANWDWICEDAVGYAGQQDPAVGVTASASLLSGSFEGLSVSLDSGCGWSFATGGLQNVVDLVVRPDSPHQALAITNAFAGSGDAGNLYRSQVWTTADDGAHWTALGQPLDPTMVVVTIEVAASDPQRIYVSGHIGAKFSGAGVLLVSTDGGATFTPRTVPLDATSESDPYVAAVDPKNADVVYLRTDGMPSSRLLVTADAGKSFATKYTGGTMLGFALSPDGAKVYLGGAADGLQVASTADFVFRQTSTVPVQCLRTSGNDLYVCSDELSAGFTLGASTDDGATIAPKLHAYGVRGPLACASSSSTAVCAAAWPALQQQLGSPPTPPADAGRGSDASQGADSGEPRDASDAASPIEAESGPPAPPAQNPRSSDCNCRTGGARSSGDAPLGVALALVLWIRRRRFARGLGPGRSAPTAPCVRAEGPGVHERTTSRHQHG